MNASSPRSVSDGELYSATVSDFSGSDPLIYKEPLRTDQSDSKHLNCECHSAITLYSDDDVASEEKEEKHFVTGIFLWPLERTKRKLRERKKVCLLFLTLSLFPFPFAFTTAPDFVRGLSDDEYVYFFFREQAVEYINCGKVSGTGTLIKKSQNPDGMTGQNGPASCPPFVRLPLPS